MKKTGITDSVLMIAHYNYNELFVEKTGLTDNFNIQTHYNYHVSLLEETGIKDSISLVNHYNYAESLSEKTGITDSLMTNKISHVTVIAQNDFAWIFGILESYIQNLGFWNVLSKILIVNNPSYFL